MITEIECKKSGNFIRSKKGKKITNIHFIDNQFFLVSSNDNRLRILDISSYKILQKYKGNKNKHFFIRADYNADKEIIICGSEDEKTYFWKRAPNNQMYKILFFF